MKQSLLMSLLTDEKLASYPGSFCRPCLKVTELEFTWVFLAPELGLHHRPTACAFWHAHHPHYEQTHHAPYHGRRGGFSPVRLQVGPDKRSRSSREARSLHPPKSTLQEDNQGPSTNYQPGMKVWKQERAAGPAHAQM